jgi:hypothetical protein
VPRNGYEALFGWPVRFLARASELEAARSLALLAGIRNRGYSVKRFLTGPEAQALLGQLTPDRAARVAFILATGARWGETDRLTAATSRPPPGASCCAVPRPSWPHARCPSSALGTTC